ncbi:MAG: Lpg1974 family pore-forming outer membrane protein [Pseudomonadota bacterium]
MSKGNFLRISLASLLVCYASAGQADTTWLQTKLFNNSSNEINKSSVYGGLLYLRPYSNNLKYATFVSGEQPYSQSWHYQEINPSYHPSFELGINYAIPHTLYSLSASWLYLDSNDSSSKQADPARVLPTVEFVGPPYEMSPPVFGIKRVNSSVNFNFNSILLNGAKIIEFGNNIQTKVFGGISFLKLNQTIDTVFSDYEGATITPYSYPLPADPSFSFETQNVSKYFGAGPDFGLSMRYRSSCGLGLMGEFLGMLTAGTIQAQDNFTSTSARLTLVGIGTSHQEITTPNVTQVVMGADGKLGIFYTYIGKNIPEFTVEVGYRIASYLNAISSINPNTLVQPGLVVGTPEFSTGTMAIVSTNALSHSFNYNGPFINFKLAIA